MKFSLRFLVAVNFHFDLMENCGYNLLKSIAILVRFSLFIDVNRVKFSVYFAVSSETSLWKSFVSLHCEDQSSWQYLMTSTDSLRNCRQTFQSANSSKGFFSSVSWELFISTLIAVVREEELASLIFYGFKTHSLEIHHYFVNHTKFDCFLCVF